MVNDQQHRPRFDSEFRKLHCLTYDSSSADPERREILETARETTVAAEPSEPKAERVAGCSGRFPQLADPSRVIRSTSR